VQFVESVTLHSDNFRELYIQNNWLDYIYHVCRIQRSHLRIDNYVLASASAWDSVSIAANPENPCL
jgi:hypothetical protein